MNFIKEDMCCKIRQKAVFVSNGNKSVGISELNKSFDEGYVYKGETYLKESDETYGGILYILEKDESN